MTVYVDDMMLPKKIDGVRWEAKWSHMMADTHEELEEMARALGLSQLWIQHEGSHKEHYDVTMSVRKRAIEMGAVEISYPSGTGDLLGRKRIALQVEQLNSLR